MATRNIEQQLVELEKEYWQAVKDKDADTALRLTDDFCIVTGAQGVGHMDKQKLAGMMKGAPYTLNAFELQDIEVRLLSDDVAILAYKVREELTVEDKPVKLEASDASTWVRRDGRWRCALHTESIAGDQFGRDRH
jgi:uncharacterized protein (TIGR02246 family)